MSPHFLYAKAITLSRHYPSIGASSTAVQTREGVLELVFQRVAVALYDSWAMLIARSVMLMVT